MIWNVGLLRNIYFYLFIYLLFSHNKDYTSITLYKDVARGPQKTTRLVRGGPLVTIILSNRTITTHNNGQYKTHYRYSRKSKTFVLNDCNVKIEVTEFGKEFQILGPWNKIENCAPVKTLINKITYPRSNVTAKVTRWFCTGHLSLGITRHLL